MITCRCLTPGEYALWDEFVFASAQGCVFHTSAYKRTVDASYGGEGLVLVGAFHGDQLVGGCVALERKRIGLRLAVTPLLTPYVGFLAGQEDEREVLTALGEWMRARYAYQLISCSPATANAGVLSAIGYTVNTRYTFEIDLDQSLDDIWTGFDASVRRQIRKAERAGFEIWFDALPMEEAFGLFRQTFERRKEKCPVSREFFEQFVSGEHVQPYRLQIAAYSAGALVSFICLLNYKELGYYAIAATAADQLSSGVSSMLVWKALEHLQEKGARRFDFVGANIPSIARFKEGFGPTKVAFYQVENYRSLSVKLARNVIRLIRR